jgi:hypothetical protein
LGHHIFGPARHHSLVGRFIKDMEFRKHDRGRTDT